MKNAIQAGTGRVVVVTGAARGIGRAITAGLLADGMRIVGLDRSWDENPFPEHRFLPLTADVTSESDLSAALDATLSQFGTVDVIINNAAYRQRDVDPSAFTRVLDIPISEWRTMLEVTTLGPLMVSKVFGRPLISRRSGAIINISSDSGAQGKRGNQPYGAAKAALTNWTQSLALELAELNIRVNIVFPPGTRTTGYDDYTRLQEQATGKKWTLVPYSPEATVPVVRHLAVEMPDVTGQIFVAARWNVENGFGGLEQWKAQ
jgi:NAD(P)-dependent dehydrogenase (short-subunit alcohol dehydrogenase family)